MIFLTADLSDFTSLTCRAVNSAASSGLVNAILATSFSNCNTSVSTARFASVTSCSITTAESSFPNRAASLSNISDGFSTAVSGFVVFVFAVFVCSNFCFASANFCFVCSAFCFACVNFANSCSINLLISSLSLSFCFARSSKMAIICSLFTVAPILTTDLAFPKKELYDALNLFCMIFVSSACRALGMLLFVNSFPISVSDIEVFNACM